MDARSMELTVISARDLNYRSIFSKTKAYAVAWISDDLKIRQRTPVDKYSGNNPTWNQIINFILNDASLQQGHLVLEIAIYSDGTFCNKEIGHVSIPLKEFVKSGAGSKGTSAAARLLSYQVRKASGKAMGVLNVSVKLAEKPDLSNSGRVQ